METYSALLVRRDPKTAASQVFLSLDSVGWRLPVFVPPHDIYNTDAQAANMAVHEQFGVSVVTRQSLRLPEPALGNPLNIYVLERRYDHAPNSSALRVNGQWIGYESLHEVDFVLPKEGAAVKAWFAEASGENIPSLQLPWWEEGWFEATSRRLETHVRSLGRTSLAPVEQIRSAYTSALLRVLTNEGFVYLKEVPAPFVAQEIALTRMLSQRDSAHYPIVLAAAEDHLVLQDIGPFQSLEADTPRPRWEEVIGFYGQLQVSSVDSVPQWLSLGCADIRTQSLIDQMDALLAQVPERLLGLKQQLSTEELTRLRTLGPTLAAMCTELSAYGIPDALDHGDLHAGNIALRENDFVLYDWSHVCVTCPFYGFGSLFLDDDWFPGQTDALPRILEVYLECWTGYTSMPRLQAAFALWKRLRPLFSAAHQSHVIAAYQKLLNGNAYLAETATGNSLEYMQWWLSGNWRDVIASFES